MTGAHSYVEVDGAQIWLETSGTGPPLLFLNGGFGTTELARTLIDALAAHFTVHAFDPRGHGRSTLGRGRVTYVREAADAIAVLDFLGLDEAHVLGHSDGACAALHLLLDFGHRVRTATLSGTPYHRDHFSELAKRLLVELPATLMRREPDALGLQERLITDGMSPSDIAALATALAPTWRTAPVFTRAMLAEICAPVLVVEAGADPLVPAARLRELREAIPGALALELTAMGHDPLPFAAEIAAAAAALATGPLPAD